MRSTTATCSPLGTAASERDHVGLADALELTLLILTQEPQRFRAAALRGHSRYVADTRASLEEATAVLGLLAMLEGRGARTAARALAELLDNRTLMPAVEVLGLDRCALFYLTEG